MTTIKFYLRKLFLKIFLDKRRNEEARLEYNYLKGRIDRCSSTEQIQRLNIEIEKFFYKYVPRTYGIFMFKKETKDVYCMELFTSLKLYYLLNSLLISSLELQHKKNLENSSE